MKSSITKNIILINMAIVAIIYIFAATRGDGMMIGFFSTLLQTVVNIGIAMILLFIYLSTNHWDFALKKAMKGLFVSAGLVLLISFPTCLLIEQIHPLRFAG